jgi:hypothetical protein
MMPEILVMTGVEGVELYGAPSLGLASREEGRIETKRVFFNAGREEVEVKDSGFWTRHAKSSLLASHISEATTLSEVTVTSEEADHHFESSTRSDEAKHFGSCTRGEKMDHTESQTCCEKMEHAESQTGRAKSPSFVSQLKDDQAKGREELTQKSAEKKRLGEKPVENPEEPAQK